MAQDDTSNVSSPLSSVREDLTAPSSPLAHRKPSENDENTAQSPSETHEESEEDAASEQWDDDVFANDGPKPSKPTDTINDPLSSPPTTTAGAEAGFAQSDIDAAIAASLVNDTATTPAAKRARETTEDAVSDVEQPPKKTSKTLSGAAKAAANRRKVAMYTSEKSPLIKINLTKLLRLPEAWRALSYAQQKELAAMLPEQPDIGGTGAQDSNNVLGEALMNNDALRTDVREWHEGLESGFEDPEWREEAAEAMEKRARGEIGSGKWWEKEDEKHDGENGATNGVVEAWWKDPNLTLTSTF